MMYIGCLSQKGGVGKSTLARLMAFTFARGGWNVKIADFNVKQKTSVDWSAIRMTQGIDPEVPAEAFTDVNKALNIANVHMVVFDGKPDSDNQTIALAKHSNVILVPTGISVDDLIPQIRFTQELKMRGIDGKRILFALNNVTDSPAAITEARNMITSAGFVVAESTIPRMQSYMNAQNTGRCISETEYPKLNNRAEHLAADVVERIRQESLKEGLVET